MDNSIREDLRKGMAANLPVAASVIAYGSVLGVLAAQKSIGWEQLLFMNLSIFAGSAQFVMVDILPWVGAALFSILGNHFLPGKWYVVTGGIGGALLAILDRTNKETAQ